MQLLSDALTLDGLDWTGLGAATPVAPQGLEGYILPGVHVTRSLEANKV